MKCCLVERHWNEGSLRAGVGEEAEDLCKHRSSSSSYCFIAIASGVTGVKLTKLLSDIERQRLGCRDLEHGGDPWYTQK